MATATATVQSSPTMKLYKNRTTATIQDNGGGIRHAPRPTPAARVPPTVEGKSAVPPHENRQHDGQTRLPRKAARGHTPISLRNPWQRKTRQHRADPQTNRPEGNAGARGTKNPPNSRQHTGTRGTADDGGPPATSRPHAAHDGDHLDRF